MTAARWIVDPPLAAATNMARDETLLAGRTGPTLRFYRWARPALSLGWFQPAAALPVEEVLARGGEAVRRPSGGKAILHEHELTYALSAPEAGPLGGGPARAMAWLHRVLAGELTRQGGRTVSLRGNGGLRSDVEGSPWCFEASTVLDLVLDGRKLLGSAARRRRGWILFHGSLVLEAPRETPGVAAFGREPDLGALAAAFGQALGMAFQRAAWLDGEVAEARERSRRFADPGHLFRR